MNIIYDTSRDGRQGRENRAAIIRRRESVETGRMQKIPFIKIHPSGGSGNFSLPPPSHASSARIHVELGR